ncbi:MAG TPA: DPP IV N-terminal domain-containing protein [Planctomycetaceae bacterium]|nr:DPP IV N-terminal domain-containing protein [Planctomycetaceae bacterium]
MQLWNTHPSFTILAAASILACVPSPMVSAQSQRQTMAKHTAGASAPASTSSANHVRASLRQPEFLEQYAATHRFGNGRPTNVEITRTGDAVLFLRSGPRSAKRDLYEFNVATGAERVLATAAQLLGGAQEQLSAEEKARRERMRLSAGGIASFAISDDGRTVLVPLSGKLFLVDRATGAIRELTSKSGSPIDAQFSPDGKLVACVRDGELYVIDLASGHEKRLTHGASATLTHGLAEFVAQEEMGRMHGYWWSPDSRTLVYQETNTADVEELLIPDPAHPERPPQTERYPRPGKNNARVRLGVVAVTGGATKWLDWDHDAFPYLARVSWAKNTPLVILVQNREQTLEVLYEVDPTTGHTQELLREADDAWVNLDDGHMPKWLRDGKSFLWSTERRGGWQLELHNRDGSLARVLTPPELNYRHLIGIDESAGTALFGAGEDPTQTQIYRVSLNKESPPEQLTHEPGVHGAVLSEESGVSVRSAQSLTSESKQVVYRRDGSAVGELTSVAERPSLEPIVELVTVGSEPQLHAAIVRPHDFEAGKHYPVIVSVYAGPHSQMVTASRAHYLLDGWLANQGFIVVSIDGRGTPARGRAWERAIKDNFIEFPLADQVRGLQALGAKFPELDLKRVGIFGWSFGGYFTAMAVTKRPDVYHAGVAGAPVTDWLDYDTHYTERYLGVPTKSLHPYQVSSVLEVAHELHRPLLLIHGTADDNVFFLHSIRLADTLFRAGREFEFLPLAGQTHMVSKPPEVRELYTRIATYFLEHLR